MNTYNFGNKNGTSLFFFLVLKTALFQLLTQWSPNPGIVNGNELIENTVYNISMKP